MKTDELLNAMLPIAFMATWILGLVTGFIFGASAKKSENTKP